MLYQKGDSVLFKGRYQGRIKLVYYYNKTYVVEIYNYGRFGTVDRQCDQHDLSLYKQLSLL